MMQKSGIPGVQLTRKGKQSVLMADMAFPDIAAKGTAMRTWLLFLNASNDVGNRTSAL